MHQIYDMERTILHLQIEDRHEYFGSPSSLFDKYTREDIGITQAALNNYFSKLGENYKPIYKNTKCTIKKAHSMLNPRLGGARSKDTNCYYLGIKAPYSAALSYL